MFRGVYRGTRHHAGKSITQFIVYFVVFFETRQLMTDVNNLIRTSLDDLAQVLRRSRNAGVDRLLVTAGNLKMCRQALDLVRDDGTVFVAIIHPLDLAYLVRVCSIPILNSILILSTCRKHVCHDRMPSQECSRV